MTTHLVFLTPFLDAHGSTLMMVVEKRANKKEPVTTRMREMEKRKGRWALLLLFDSIRFVAVIVTWSRRMWNSRPSQRERKVAMKASQYKGLRLTDGAALCSSRV